ncbi:MAG: class I SAM-dependent methyltransferase [Opitutales bacterium]
MGTGTPAGLQAMGSIEERFTWIYENNYWQEGESASGTGSTLRYTENLRKELPGLFSRFGVQKIFDAPCGDFNWMRLVVASTGVRYQGADIVRPMIESLQTRHGSERVTFVHLDLIRGPFPRADLMVCRDCLFHLSYADARRVLENFVASGTPYLLTTTHRDDGTWVNRDIPTGGFRPMDLFAPPYSLPRDPLARVEDWVAPDPEREMCLWSREQVAAALSSTGG